MNVDEALRQFAEAEELPREAMAWALENWDPAAPRFVSKLRAFAGGGDRSEAAEDQVFYILHLCGEKGEARAYEPVCRLIAEDPDIEEWLGDALTETLTGILIKLYDGDAEPLVTAVESTVGDEYARAAALSALGYLVRSRDALDDEAMRGFLRRLRRDAPPREESSFWIAWASTAAALGYGELKIDFAMLMKDGLVDELEMDLKDFERLVECAHSDDAGLAGFASDRVGPFDDAIGALEAWSFGDDGFDEVGEDRGSVEINPFDGPYLNPLRDVGRNDPCPCGSGKKYKKCCLGA